MLALMNADYPSAGDKSIAESTERNDCHGCNYSSLSRISKHTQAKSVIPYCTAPFLGSFITKSRSLYLSGPELQLSAT